MTLLDNARKGPGDPIQEKDYPGLMMEKYTVYDESIGGNFQRIVRYMYKPETTIENVKYNEILAKKLRTKEGCFQVLEEAMYTLAQVDGDTLDKMKTDESVCMKHFNAILLGFVVTDLEAVVDGILKDPEYKDRVPENVISFMKSNTVFFQGFQAVIAEVKMYENFYHYVIPEGETPEETKEILNLFVGAAAALKDKK